MNTIQNTPTASSSGTHPLILTAAAAVTIASCVAVASFAGWLPHAKPEVPQPVPAVIATAEPVPAAVPPVAAPVVAPITTPAAAPKPAAQKVGAGGTAHGVTHKAPPVHKVPTTAAATPDYRMPPPPAAMPDIARTPPPPPPCRDCGMIESVEEVPVEGKAGVGGAIAGGVVGGIIGNQIGSGSGRTAARLLGMAGGAYAGHQIEKSGKKSVRYDITVRLEDGTRQRVSSDTPPTWRSGDRVSIQNGEIISRN